MFLIKLIVGIFCCFLGFLIAYGIGNLFGFDWKWVFVAFGQITFLIRFLNSDD